MLSYGIGGRGREKMNMTVLLFCAALVAGAGVCLLRTIPVQEVCIRTSTCQMAFRSLFVRKYVEIIFSFSLRVYSCWCSIQTNYGNNFSQIRNHIYYYGEFIFLFVYYTFFLYILITIDDSIAVISSTSDEAKALFSS